MSRLFHLQLILLELAPTHLVIHLTLLDYTRVSLGPRNQNKIADHQSGSFFYLRCMTFKGHRVKKVEMPENDYYC